VASDNLIGNIDARLRSIKPRPVEQTQPARQVRPLDLNERIERYRRQRDGGSLTPKQRRRAARKHRHSMAPFDRNVAQQLAQTIPLILDGF
jgi:hypothetical protein